MPQLVLMLVTGKEVRLEVDDAEDALGKIRDRQPPFDAEWIEAGNQLVRADWLVTVGIVGEPAFSSG